jgi:hypothetical protein
MTWRLLGHLSSETAKAQSDLAAILASFESNLVAAEQVLAFSAGAPCSSTLGDRMKVAAVTGRAV